MQTSFASNPSKIILVITILKVMSLIFGEKFSVKSSLLKNSTNNWVDLLSLEIKMLLCFPYSKVACLHVSFTAYEYFYKII